MSLSLRGIQHGFCQVRKQLFLGSRSNSRTMVLVQINLVTLGSRSGTTEPQSLVAAGTEGPGERRGSPGPGACGCLGTWGGGGSACVSGVCSQRTGRRPWSLSPAPWSPHHMWSVCGGVACKACWSHGYCNGVLLLGSTGPRCPALWSARCHARVFRQDGTLPLAV